MRVVQLPTEIAGQMITTVNALREIGIVATAACTKDNRFGYVIDYNFSKENIPSPLLRKCKKLMFFLKMLFYYDIIHYHCGHSFYGNSYLDMKIFKFFKKKMVVEFWGSDIRKPSIAKAKNPYYMNAANISDEDAVALQQKVSKYISNVIVSDYEMRDYIDSTFRDVYLISQRIDVRLYTPHYPKSSETKPLIVHAPSLRGYKGTEIILKVIGELKDLYSFRFELVENLPHNEAIERYSHADLIIDEIRTGSYGILAIEAMALGKPVICYIRPDLYEKYPEDLPIVSASPDNVKQKLIDLLIDGEKRTSLGVAGRSYVEKYHDSLKLAKQIRNIYRKI